MMNFDIEMLQASHLLLDLLHEESEGLADVGVAATALLCLQQPHRLQVLDGDHVLKAVCLMQTNDDIKPHNSVYKLSHTYIVIIYTVYI